MTKYKSLLTHVPLSPSGHVTYFELRGPQKGSVADNLEKQSRDSHYPLEFYILMKTKSKVYKLFIIINDLTTRKAFKLTLVIKS